MNPNDIMQNDESFDTSNKWKKARERYKKPKDCMHDISMCILGLDNTPRYDKPIIFTREVHDRGRISVRSDFRIDTAHYVSQCFLDQYDNQDVRSHKLSSEISSFIELCKKSTSTYTGNTSVYKAQLNVFLSTRAALFFLDDLRSIELPKGVTIEDTHIRKGRPTHKLQFQYKSVEHLPSDIANPSPLITNQCFNLDIIVTTFQIQESLEAVNYFRGEFYRKERSYREKLQSDSLGCPKVVLEERLRVNTWVLQGLRYARILLEDMQESAVSVRQFLEMREKITKWREKTIRFGSVPAYPHFRETLDCLMSQYQAALEELGLDIKYRPSNDTSTRFAIALQKLAGMETLYLHDNKDFRNENSINKGLNDLLGSPSTREQDKNRGKVDIVINSSSDQIFCECKIGYKNDTFQKKGIESSITQIVQYTENHSAKGYLLYYAFDKEVAEFQIVLTKHFEDNGYLFEQCESVEGISKYKLNIKPGREGGRYTFDVFVASLWSKSPTDRHKEMTTNNSTINASQSLFN
ncbi:hypothetical protein [Photobacterium sanguinicancri]|uniref:hypothetical protein n=1 Tax=Photobacterium sanguinicancri TaxID=875932 RepID=UPI0026E364F7|nr:hypothetical protein [Photobacterium sanguinicancri]MDO6498574.1 hypothetical protein [Photobacterium sanguinicancri]